MNPETTAFLFPGQGSQEIGMGYDLCQVYSEAKETFKQSNQLLGFNLSKIAWNGPEHLLNETINTQPAILTHSIAALRVFTSKFPDFTPAYIAGHSMGELSALVAGSTMNFQEALVLARKRGELMAKAGEISPGGMAAILALDTPKVELICTEACLGNSLVQIANDNCPGQVVISGDNKALERAMDLARDAKARKVVKLAVSIAAHSPLMSTAQDEFNLVLQNTSIIDPLIPIVGNVNALPLTSAAQVREDLSAQLYSRVRWTETINYLVSNGIKTFIEFGSGDVLVSLVKRIKRDTERISLGASEDFAKLKR